MKALVLNCTLKPSPETSSTEALARVVIAELEKGGASVEMVRLVDLNLKPGIRTNEGKGDDCSVLVAVNRRGVIVNLLTGPPSNMSDDAQWVNHFNDAEGIHLIAGGSTAKIAARELNRRIEVVEAGNAITPPAYLISGFELVTEGMVTLNQVYHLLDEDPADYPADSSAAELAAHLKMADRINVWLGQAPNASDGNIEFKQQGLLNREKIAAKIVKRLREQGKLVVVEKK